MFKTSRNPAPMHDMEYEAFRKLDAIVSHLLDGMSRREARTWRRQFRSAVDTPGREDFQTVWRSLMVWMLSDPQNGLSRQCASAAEYRDFEDVEQLYLDGMVDVDRLEARIGHSGVLPSATFAISSLDENLRVRWAQTFFAYALRDYDVKPASVLERLLSLLTPVPVPAGS